MKEIRVKVIVAGESGSGKSIINEVNDACLPLRRFGVSIGLKTMDHEDAQCRMTFITWTLTKGRPKDTSYFEGSKAAVILCDLTKEPTIKKMSAWAKSIRKGIGKVPLVFVGNNVDEASKNNVEMMNEIAKSYASPTVFTHLEDRDSIEEVFVQIINAVRPNSGEDVFKPEQQDNPPFKHQA